MTWLKSKILCLVEMQQQAAGTSRSLKKMAANWVLAKATKTSHRSIGEILLFVYSHVSIFETTCIYPNKRRHFSINVAPEEVQWEEEAQ